VSNSVPGPMHTRKMATKSVGFAAYQCDVSGTFTLMNGMATGTTQIGDRIGRDIYMHELLVTGFVQNRTAAVINQARIMVVIDTMPGGATPVLNELLEGYSSLYFANKLTARRFIILYDNVIALVGQPATTGTDAVKSVNLRVPLNMAAYYNATNGGTIADIEKNALYVVTCGSNAAGTSAAEAYFSLQLTYIAQ